MKYWFFLLIMGLTFSVPADEDLNSSELSGDHFSPAFASVVRTGSTQDLRQFLTRGAVSVSALNQGLHLALKQEEINSGQLGLLLSAGADPNSKISEMDLAQYNGSHTQGLEDTTGELPLITAAARGDIAAAELLLSYGANIDAVNSASGSALREAVYRSNYDMVLFLLKHHPEITRSVLFRAVRYSQDTRIIAALLEHNYLDSSILNQLLLEAIQKGRPKMASELLKKGAEPSVVQESHVCCLQSETMLNFFLDQFPDLDLKLIWRLAARYPAPRTLSVLMQRGVDPRTPVDGGGSLLDQVMSYFKQKNIPEKTLQDYLEVLTLLVHSEVFGKERFISYKGVFWKVLPAFASIGLVPKKWQALYNRKITPSLLEELRSSGIINARDSEGNTVFSGLQMSEQKHYDFLFSLLNYANLDVKDQAGHTPLHIVIVQEASSVESQDRRSLAVRNLLEAGANPNLPNAQGLTPLHLAVQKHDIAMLQMLLQHHGINLNVQDNQGYTAFHLAVQQDDARMVQELIRAGAELNILDRKKNKPEFYAQSVAVKYFLGLDVDREAMLSEGTALLRAVSVGDVQKVFALLRQGDVVVNDTLLEYEKQHIQGLLREEKGRLESRTKPAGRLTPDFNQKPQDDSTAETMSVENIQTRIGEIEQELQRLESGETDLEVKKALYTQILEQVVRSGQEEVFVALLSHEKTKPTQRLFEMVLHEGTSNLAAILNKFGFTSVDADLLASIRNQETIDFLLNSTPNLDLTAVWFLAVQNSNARMLTALLKRGFDPRIVDEQGRTATFYAQTQEIKDLIQAHLASSNGTCRTQMGSL